MSTNWKYTSEDMLAYQIKVTINGNDITDMVTAIELGADGVMLKFASEVK